MSKVCCNVVLLLLLSVSLLTCFVTFLDVFPLVACVSLPMSFRNFYIFCSTRICQFGFVRLYVLVLLVFGMLCLLHCIVVTATAYIPPICLVVLYPWFCIALGESY